MKQNRLIILLLIILSFSILITGCTNDSNTGAVSSYIIGGTVTLNEGTEENVILKIEDSQGVSTINPDSNGKWNSVVSEGTVTVTPTYDRNSDGVNDYDFSPSSWSNYVSRDTSNIDFEGTFYPSIQKMLGDWQFSYTIGSTNYIEYYVFDNPLRQDSETGQYYTYGYKEGEYSSSLGYQSYGIEHTSIATYSEEDEVYEVLWLSPDIYGYGSYFEFNFTSANEVSGSYYLIDDGELQTADPMTGERTNTYNSALSSVKTTINTELDELIKELNQKHDESNEVSSNSYDPNTKIKIKENAYKNKSK